MKIVNFQVEIDSNKAFKNLFVTNAFDESEDYLVSERLFKLIGPQMKKFRQELMKEKSTKDLNVLLKSIPMHGTSIACFSDCMDNLPSCHVL